MNKRLLSLLLAAGIASAALAQGQLSGYTRMYLLEQAKQTASLNGAKRAAALSKTVKAFVNLQDGAAIPALPEGVTLHTQIGQTLIVSTPVGSLEALANLEGVKSVAMSQPVYKHNKNTRTVTRQDEVNATTDPNTGSLLTGKGVLVGVVDGGIDFNHINYKDANGKSRVKLAMLSSKDLTPITNPDSIAKLTYDDTSTHGTHTSGTAAGSYTANGLQGMAPEADLALSGLQEDDSDDDGDAAAVESMQKIFAYADSVGQPAVINFSAGRNDGPHDAQSSICPQLEALTGPGRIIVISAGNEGGRKMCVEKTLTETETSFKTAINGNVSEDKPGYYTGNVWEAFTYSGSPVTLQFHAVNTLTLETLCSSPVVKLSKETPSWQWSQDSESYEQLQQYFQGQYLNSIQTPADISVTFSSQGETSGLRVKMNGVSIEDFYLIAVEVKGEAGQTVKLWGSETESSEIPGFEAIADGYVEGDDTGSFNSFLCAPSVIGVGAWVANTSWTDINGNLQNDEEYFDKDRGHIASFSSYGIDADGVAHPDICAPGVAVISAVNSYGPLSDTRSIVSQTVQGGRTYQWMPESGTSMAAPVVSGIIATWLQYAPKLTPADIKTVFKETATQDEYVKAGNPVQWGSGKIDAYKGLQYILSTGVDNPNVSQHNVLFYPTAQGHYRLFTQGETAGVDVTVYNVSGATVWQGHVQASSADAATLDLSQLAAGIYVLSVKGKSIDYSTKFAVK